MPTWQIKLTEEAKSDLDDFFYYLLVIAVPSEAYGTYLTDYFRARYARVLARMEGE
ncbi:MAG: hypothetical protein IK016_06960 [Lachnospiraceae bacterium]|nr:hypothetical protein [Lachnospiraceae bacterium]